MVRLWAWMANAGVGYPGLTEIESNLGQLRERIRRASERAGRNPSEVQLVAVTKGFPPETIRLAAQTGLTRSERTGLKRPCPSGRLWSTCPSWRGT